MLTTIAYISTAALPMSADGLAELLAKAQRHNAQHQISGLLVYHHQYFLQILEGHSQPIEALMARIMADPRHHHVTTIYRAPLQQRYFIHWNMGFIAPRHPELTNAPALRHYTDRPTDPMLSSLMSGASRHGTLLHSFVENSF
jgi:hypothetical protein